uniref:Plastin 2 n=1 Tax=Echinococcus granulosus TaxID=6210 RepID=A0A068WCD9_ECHGR|nr:plastin 2 [Echinococcus granulosus]
MARKENGDDLYEKCSDGFLLCKIINCSAPQTIDLRALHRGKRLTTYQVMENITLALNSARAIGCNVVNIGAADIIGLLRQINVVAHSELVALLDEDETITEFAKLAPEQILMRWVNYHLKRADCDARMENFTIDVKDCEVYAYLLEQISPPEKKPFLHSSKAILDAVDLVQRAEMVLQNAEKLNCRVFVQPKDIINGSMKLNLAFLANLFNTNPALEPPTPQQPAPVIEETREEKSEEEPQPPPSRWECLLAWLKVLLPQAPQATRVPRAWFRANYDLLGGKDTKLTGKYLAE